MANVVRFVLDNARNLYVPGAGQFRAGVLDVDANNLAAVKRARYLVQPFRAVELGIVASTEPPPNLPAAPGSVTPTPDPYPQYLTDAEIASSPTLRAASVAAVQDAIAGGDIEVGADVPAASTTVPGIVELATTGETTTGTDTARAVTPAGVKAVVDALPTGGSVFGTDDAGNPYQPWKPAPVLSGNLAVPTSALPFSATSTATGQTIRAARADLLAGGRVSLPDAARVYFTTTNPVSSANFGRAQVFVTQRASNGINVVATTPLVSNADFTGFRSQEEIKLEADTRYLDIDFVFPNNYTGTLTLSEIDIRLIAQIGPRIITGTLATDLDAATTDPGGNLMVDRPAQAANGIPLRIRNIFGNDSTQEVAWGGAASFRESRYPNPVGQSLKSDAGSVVGPSMVGLAHAWLHQGNNDLILNVEKASAPGVYELRCNSHGGESGRTGVFKDDYIFEYDRGDGVWNRIRGNGHPHQAYRMRATLRTKVVHSDSATPFANIDRVYTTFADGVTRCDRKITFLTASKVERFFYIMHSLHVETASRLGRIGKGATVLRDVNCQRPTNPGIRLNAGVAAGVTTIPTSGPAQLTAPPWVGSFVRIGTVGGNAEVRRVTAASGGSLTLDSALTNAHSASEPISQLDQPTTLSSAATAGASTLTLADSIPRNAVLLIGSGHRQEARRITDITTVGAPYTATLDFPIDNTHAAGTAVQVILPGDDSQIAPGDWCAYYEPEYGTAFGQVFDRQAIAAHGLGGVLTTNLLRNTATNYVAKAYTFLLPPAPVALAAGAVVEDCYFFHYWAPRSPVSFHTEIARLAQASPEERNAVYPAT